MRLSEQEKNRIRKLHQKHSLIKEQETENLDINIDAPLVGDDIVKTDVSIVEPGDDGFESSVLPASYHVWRWCHHGGPRVFYAGNFQQGIQGTQLEQQSTIFYNSMGSPSPGEIIHITMDPSLPQRRMCFEYLGFQIRTTALDNSATPFPTSTAVRDPGSFTNCQDCEQGGQQGPDGYCIDCVNAQMTYYPGPAGQQWTQCPQGFVDIGPTPNPPGGGPCVECQQGNCTAVGWGSGGQNHFNSMSDCQNSQQCSQQAWECVNGQCAPVAGPAGPGQFVTLADCQGQCGQTYPNYKCTAGPQGCVQNNNGQYTGPNALQDCEAACCQTNITNWNWGPLPNPTCQQVCAKLNTPAMTANPITNFIHQCRYDWLVAQGCNCSGVSQACCSDQNFAVGWQTNDPLGCIGQTWVQTMNTFIQNSPNWPGQGCSWLNTVLGTAQQQLQDAIQNNGPQSVLACKRQGKVDFINNFKQTGQSTYVTGQASFPVPPGC